MELTPLDGKVLPGLPAEVPEGADESRVLIHARAPRAAAEVRGQSQEGCSPSRLALPFLAGKDDRKDRRVVADRTDEDHIDGDSLPVDAKPERVSDDDDAPVYRKVWQWEAVRQLAQATPEPAVCRAERPPTALLERSD